MTIFLTAMVSVLLFFWHRHGVRVVKALLPTWCAAVVVIIASSVLMALGYKHAFYGLMIAVIVFVVIDDFRISRARRRRKQQST